MNDADVAIARLEERLGALKSNFGTLEARVEEVSSKLDEVLEALQTVKGGGKTILYVAGVVTSIIGGLAWLYQTFVVPK